MIVSCQNTKKCLRSRRSKVRARKIVELRNLAGFHTAYTYTLIERVSIRSTRDLLKFEHKRRWVITSKVIDIDHLLDFAWMTRSISFRAKGSRFASSSNDFIAAASIFCISAIINRSAISRSCFPLLVLISSFSTLAWWTLPFSWFSMLYRNGV